MNKRMTDTDIWEQRWFKRMSAGNKLAFFYIRDHCNHAGIWSMDIIQLCEEMGIDEFNLDRFLEQVNRDFDPVTGATQERIRFKRVNGRYLWMIGYITFNWGGKSGLVSKYNSTVQSAFEILKGLKLHDEAIDNGYVVIEDKQGDNPLSTLSEPPVNPRSTGGRPGTYKDKDIDKDTSTDSFKEKGQKKSETPPSSQEDTIERINRTPVPEDLQSQEFMECYQKYQKHVLMSFQRDVTPLMTAEHFDQLIRFQAKGHDPTAILNQTIADGNKKLYAPPETKIHTLHGEHSTHSKKLSRSEDAEAYLTGLYNA